MSIEDLQAEMNRLGKQILLALPEEDRVDFQRLMNALTKINTTHQTPPQVLSVSDQSLFAFLDYAQTCIDALSAEEEPNPKLSLVTGMILGFRLGRESLG